MKVKQFTAWCNEYRQRWNKTNLWDTYCVVGDAWFNGYYKAREEIGKSLESNEEGYLAWTSAFGEEEVEVPDEPNQTGMEDKYGKMTLEDKLKRDIGKFYSCDDFRVHIAEDGRVSFQGSFKK